MKLLNKVLVLCEKDYSFVPIGTKAETTYQPIGLHPELNQKLLSPFYFFLSVFGKIYFLRRFPFISGPQGSLGRVVAVIKLQVPGRSVSRVTAHTHRSIPS